MGSSYSLDEYMSKAVRHYSSLFTLPSKSKIILSIGFLCILGGISAIVPLSRFDQTVVVGLFFGATLFVVTIMSDFIVCRSCMKDDPVFNLRRCSALSVFSWLVWLGFMFIGSVISFLAHVSIESLELWVKLFFFGFCPVLMLRLLVFSTTSLASHDGIFVSAILQPIFCTVSFVLIGPFLGYHVGAGLLPILLLSVLIAVVTVFLFTFLLDRMGKSAVGIASLSLFKAFLANWIADENAPLEGFLEKLAVERNVRVSLLGFGVKEKMKAVMVVPACHPGPFKNVGSSLLPYLIQDSLGNKLHCVVAVPHGLFGHEADLSSQFQNRKVLEGILSAVDAFSSLGCKATPFVRVRENNASVSCQMFEGCAVFTLTLAPGTTEDLPQELESMITEDAENAKIQHVLVINAHNSIEGTSEPSDVVGVLKKTAAASLRKALPIQKLPLEIGAAAIIPKEFSVKEGMGPGGISVIAVKVGDQKAAYITIDGNNMVSGLREKILLELPEFGVHEAEVLTTDTHAVNGVVRTARGYYPVGEAIDQKTLINYIKQAVSDALNNMEPAEALWAGTVIPNVKVIGKKQIETLCLLAEKTLNRAKKLSVLLFSLAGVLWVTLFLLF